MSVDVITTTCTVIAAASSTVVLALWIAQERARKQTQEREFRKWRMLNGIPEPRSATWPTKVFGRRERRTIRR